MKPIVGAALFVAGGIAAGIALSRGNMAFRPVAVKALAYGLDAKDAVVAAAAKVRDSASALAAKAGAAAAPKAE